MKGRGREVAHFRTQKAAGLLAFLALHPGRAHPREELADRFWPDADREAGRTNLRAALASLRRDLGENASGEDADTGGILQADRQSVSLDTAQVTTDIQRFEDELRRAARATDATEKTAALMRAVTLYRGALLPGFYDDWILTERERLQALQVRALRELVSILAAEGKRDRALAFAHQAVVLEPLDEEGYADILRLYAAEGQFAALTRQYKEMARRWRDELDAEPSSAIHALYERLLRQRPAFSLPETESAVLPVTPDVPSSAPPNRVTLPAPLTRFFGREAEIQALVELLRGAKSDLPAARLVTLTGAGGTGKTRLAIEAGRRLTEDSDASVCFVPLADITRGDLLPVSLMRALQLTPEPGVAPCERLLAGLATFDGTLILDNFEQLVEEGAELVQQMLEAAPRLRILVTSRQRLDIGGEREFPVLPLAVPHRANPDELPEGFPGVQLFVDRARAVRPDFPMNRENAAILSAICERLDGLPLALELAAAWAQTLTPAQILTGLDDRFRLLTTRRKDAPERHRSLRSAVEWSFQTLEPAAQRFFVRLSVFRGGCTLETAAAICDEPNALEYIALLQERSLVIATPDGPEMRFRLLETLREYGQAQLSVEEREALSLRHADFFLEFALGRRRRLDSPQQEAVLEELEAEHDNLRAIMEWTIAKPGAEFAERACALAVALFRFWSIRGYTTEGRRWLNLILARQEEISDSLRAHAVYFAGNCALADRDDAEAERYFIEAMAQMNALDDQFGVVNSLTRIGIIEFNRRDFAAAERTFRVGLEQAQAGGFLESEGHLLKCLGQTLAELDDYAQAWATLERGMTVSRLLGDPHGISMMLGEMGRLALREGDFDRAEALREEQYELAHRLKSPNHEADALDSLLYIALKRRAMERAIPLCQRLADLRQWGDAAGRAENLLRLAALHLHRNDLTAASVVLQEATVLAKQAGDRTTLRQSLAVAAALAARRSDAGDAARLRQELVSSDAGKTIFGDAFLDEIVAV